ncbi:MAG: pyruvate:ferredoxin (flavodoxin) oxidoreductase [Verrucomicrobia bacterium]|nr:pyruvate:ferredoxin (flavodoxin) oxidoreductase [Verrucomicrobiota bacterium]
MISEKKTVVTMDGNEAASYIAFKTTEVCAIYPITPSSAMGEFADQWASEGRKNIWGTIPHVVEMQSEGGASGTVHGALQTGSLTSTFTASQGLLLMIPNMYKIAGELTSAVLHVAARALAAQGLSIFGDHQDVMACRQTGFAMLCASSVQEAHDMALISQASTLEARVPFIHFFDGFRTSHEVNKIELISDEAIRAMIDDDLVIAHRKRALSPDRPIIRGTAQNPDVYFQARETVNPFYAATPEIVQRRMNQFAQLTGRQYKLFDYFGDPAAERVMIIMGSGADTARETAEFLCEKGEKVGVVQVHLFRPFSIKDFIGALPKTTKAIAVLDRTKEPGSAGEPMYQDVLTALVESQADGELPLAGMPRCIGGRYGLSSKEFTPAMVNGVFEELKKDKPKNHFTIGIKDDVSNTSIDYDPEFVTESDNVVRAMFFGLGADGTVGANKNSIKIISEETDFSTQGYFVYDSKKSGSGTVSHLRFGSDKIYSTYLIQSANFIGCHQFNFIEKIDMLKHATKGAVFLLNSTYGQDQIWDHLPRRVQEQIIEKEVKFYVIDAYKVALDTGMGTRINTIMQTCFFAISGVLEREEAIAKIKAAIKKTYGKKGEEVVQKNFEAVDQTLAHLHEVKVPKKATSKLEMPPVVPDKAPDFVKTVTAEMMAGRGDELPVSALPVDGTYPTGTTRWEKRNVSLYVPVWQPELCIQCGNCVAVCPHSCIKSKHYDESALKDSPEGFKSVKLSGRGFPGRRYTLQIAVEDCTGCTLCVEVCPAKDKEEVGRKAINMDVKEPILLQERANLEFFDELPENDRSKIDFSTIRGVQYLQPLFEYSGACSGCGETPYVKMMSQLFGDRLYVANATGCSSIYGGNLPTTPWAADKNGRGPTWSNSLFEDNAEFGFGFRLTIDKQTEFARELLEELRGDIGEELAAKILAAPQTNDEELTAQRERVAALKEKLAGMDNVRAKHLLSLADMLVKKSVWIMGGDGWAYDIGYGGLDHIFASGRNVNVLVLDTEVYSNTGGQASKSTPRGAIAKFAAAGKPSGKKDLGMMAASYGNVYVAKVAMGANPKQTLRAFREAEAYEGTSLIIAYSHCIAHGINMQQGLRQQKLAVECGHWPLFRYNPELAAAGRNPMQLDSQKPTIPVSQYAYNEVRYKLLTRTNPASAEKLMKLAQQDVNEQWKRYEKLAAGK